MSDEKPVGVRCQHGHDEPSACLACNRQSELAPATGYAIPKAYFPCSNRYCAEETCYDAQQLYWYEKERRWVCENCWDDLDYENEGEDRPEKGVSLETYIKSQKLSAESIIA